MIEIEAGSPAMAHIAAGFSDANGEANNPRTLRITEHDGDTIKVKINEGTWSAPLRITKRIEPRMRCTMLGLDHAEHWADECRYGERQVCSLCELDVECIDANGNVWHDRGGNTQCPAFNGGLRHRVG